MLLWVSVGHSTSTGLDLVDVALGIIALQACQACVDDLLAVGRIVRSKLVVVVVGELGLTIPAYVDRVELRVRVGVCCCLMVVPIDDLFAVGRVGRLSAVRNFGLTTPPT